MTAAFIPPLASIVIAVEDQPAREFLADNLAADGYQAITAGNVEQALQQLESNSVDALLVDIGCHTPGLLDQIRRQAHPALDPQVPVLALAGGDWLARTRLLDRGADDVIAKPYSYPELRARLVALLRRSQARRAPHVLRAGSLRLDTRSRQTNVAGIQIEKLSGKEYELLVTLLSDPTRVFTRQELLRDIWGCGPAIRTRTLDSHVISSPVWGVGCVDCGFCPGRRRRFISSGVDSALAAVLSPRAKRRGVGAARLSTPPRHRSLSVDFLTYRPSGRVVGWA